MAIIGSSTAITRYAVEGQPHDLERYLNPKTIRDNFQAAAFKAIDDSPGEDASLGFVRYGDYLDPNMALSNPFKEPFIAVKLRLDARKIPPALMRAEVEKGTRDYQEKKAKRIKEEGLILVSKDEKKEIRDAVKARLNQHTPPTPDTADVVWDYNANTIYLASSSKAFKEGLVTLFNKAFPDLTLKEITPLYKTSFVENVDIPDTVGMMFLTWLWHKNGDHLGHQNKRVGCGIGGELTVTGKKNGDGKAESLTAKGDRETGMAGIKAEIDAGKIIKSAIVEINDDGDDYSLKLRGGDFAISGLKTPGISIPKEDAGDNDTVLREKMYLITTALNHLDAVFWSFIRDKYTMPDATADHTGALAAARA